MQKIFLTSSRTPSSKLSKFLKELEDIFPHSQKINRGSEFLTSVVSFCLLQGVKNLILVYENRSKPSALVISHLPSGPSLFFTLSNVFYGTARKKLKKNEILPNVIFDNLGSNLGLRISSVLGSLFPPTTLNSKHVVTFTGFKSIILFGHYWIEKTGYKKENFLLKKLSPSFELQPFKITLDIVSKKNQKIEWVLTPFLDSNKKKTFLSFNSKK
jgi:U3 small nucleolar ribonucleoprotein protein IMP4